MLAGRADRILVGFEDSKAFYKEQSKIIVTGTPVRGSMTNTGMHEARASLGYSGKPLVVSFWGSLGAAHMNEVTAHMIAENFRSRRFFIYTPRAGERPDSLLCAGGSRSWG
jgi:UDP-N-acetylglucosamine--N-acetylmuramyl-(pentapeptide) pyrophosphoryl-undecaprenol N-acetylglucosamine transferase